LAWPDSLSAGPDSPALSCPPNRGHSNDHSRLAYAEILDDEQAATAIGFLERGLAFFAQHGIQTQRVMTDTPSLTSKAAPFATCSPANPSAT
jgi:hypothetical protein